MTHLLCWLLAVFLLAGVSGVSAVTENTHGTTSPHAEMQAWFGDFHTPFIVAGCNPLTPSASLSLSAFACRGYVVGSEGELIYVEQDARAVGPLNAGNGTYWIALHQDNRDTSTPAGWTRQQGTAYLWMKSATVPTQPQGAVIFAEVTVAGGAISAVVDRVRPGSGWLESRTFGVRTDNPKAPNVFFVNSGFPIGTGFGPAPRVWHQYQTRTFGIPEDATSIDLGGIGIITHGTTQGDCELRVSGRAAGDTMDPLNYVQQLISPPVLGGAESTLYVPGARSPIFMRVPVRNGAFEIYWDGLRDGVPLGMGVYPADCSFGVNFAAWGYTRTSIPSSAAAAVVTPISPLTGIINVQDFGALGNGVADDTAEIQAALDAVSSSVGGTVWFPPGVYCLSDTLRVKKSRTHMLGAGAGTSILRTCTNWTTPPIAGTGVFAGQVSFLEGSITNGPTGSTRITDLSIQGFSFEGMASNNASSPKCITGLYADRVTIRDNLFLNSPYECIMPSALYGGTDWRIENNAFVNTGQSAVANAQNGTAIEANVSGATIIGNTLTNVASGIGSSIIYGRAAITGNTILNPSLAGIVLSGTMTTAGTGAAAGGTDEITVSGNTIMVQAVAGNVRRGITVLETARNVNITGNTLRLEAVSGGEELYGIALLGPFQGCHVASNTILMNAASFNLAASKKFLGIYGEGGPGNNTLRCDWLSNSIRMINNTTNVNYGGLFAMAGTGQTLHVTATGNEASGFDAVSTQFGIRLSKTTGTINYAAVANVINGRHEYNGVAYCNDTCGGLPVTSTSFGPGLVIEGQDYSPVLFASLGVPADGRVVYCADCTVTSGASNVCTGSGSGAFALRVSGLWRCFNTQPTAGGVGSGGTVTQIDTTAPLAGGPITTTGTLSIANAVADGVTKGAASFTAADFNATAGNISLDYMNAQPASASTKGFLTATDWTTFNNKQPAMGFTAVPDTRTVCGDPLTSNVTCTSSDVGLGNVDNTSNATERAATATLTNKTLNLTTNTLTGTLAQFNTAVSDANLLPDPGTNGLVNRTGATTTSPITSATVGQVLRVTGTDLFGFGTVDLSDPDAVSGMLPDANIPHLNILSTGLTVSRCVETDATGLLTVAAGPCGTPGGSGTVTQVNTTAPLSGGPITTTGTITIADAAADGATKGAASFTAADFNATAGVISIDYANAQTATGSVKGFLTAADWTTFNAKAPSSRLINTTTPLAGGGDLTADRTLSIADAAADSVTKGAAAFTTADFDAASGVISIDYPNAQAANTSTKGFLTSADWNTFNNKQPALGFTAVPDTRTVCGDPLTSNITCTASDVGLGNVDNTSNATERAATATLTNKTLNLASNTLTGTLVQFNTAVSDANLLPDPGSNGLVNRTGVTTTGAVTSSTVGQVLRVTGVDTFAFGALDLADTDAITGLLPDANLTANIARLGTANAWADGIKQTFNPNATTAGLNVGSHAGDPSAPANGDLWYDSTANELTARINGANVALGAGGGISGATANGALYATGATTGTSTAALTNGQLLIGSTGVAPVAGSLTGTANQITVTPGAGTITLSIPASPVLTTPTIASFANATHTHTNAAGGGQLTDAALSAAVTVPKGGTGATTLTGLVVGNGVSTMTALTSSTVGQIPRVTGANTYAFGALDLADTDAIMNDLPYANLTPPTAASKLLGRGTTVGDWQEITLGTNLSMSGTTLNAAGGGGTPGGSLTQVQFHDTGAVFGGDPNFTFDKTTDMLTTGIIDKGGQVFNVKAYGALGTGTDDTTAINAAIAAIPAAGGTLYFPPGIYLYNETGIGKSRVTWLGAGPTLSIVKAAAAGGGGYLTYPNLTTVDTLTFDSLGFDGNNVRAGWYADDPSRTGTLTVRNCRFVRFTSHAIHINAPNFVVHGNRFEGDGTTATQAMSALMLQRGVSYGTITNNVFRYVHDGMVADSGGSQTLTQDVTAHIEYSGNVSDLGFYTKIMRGTNVGTVTYDGTHVNDTGASFSGFTLNDFVRVMPLRTSGTGTIDGTKLTDATKNFLTVGGGVLPGEMVRSGSKMGIVAAVESATILHVEEWLSEADRSQVGAPPSGAYEVWGVYLGKWSSNTATQITVNRWTDLNGTTVTPAAATRYELLPRSPNYAFNCEYSCWHWRITNNVLLRTYSDSIAFHGSYSTIANNTIAWGQDVGITIAGHYNVVDGNTIRHLGTMGIGVDAGEDLLISNNVIIDTTWENAINTTSLAGIAVFSGNRTHIEGNVIGIESVMPLARHGIVIAGDTDSAALINNRTRGHSVAGVRFDGPTVTNTRYLGHVSTSETELSLNGATFATVGIGSNATVLRFSVDPPGTGLEALCVNTAGVVTSEPFCNLDISNILTNTSTHIVENKQMVPRVVAIPVVSNAITPNCDTTDIGTVNTIAADLTINAPTCTGSNPRDGQDLTFRLFSSAPRLLTWNAAYTAENGIPLPLVTSGNGVVYDSMMFRRNAVTGKWGLQALTLGVDKGIATLATSTTFTCNNNLYQQCEMQMTGAPGTLTMAAPTGTPANGDRLKLMTMCTNSQTFAWNAIFIASAGVELPTVCPASVTAWTVTEVQYSSVLSKWQAVANSNMTFPSLGFIHLSPVGLKLAPTDTATPDVSENNDRLLFDASTRECGIWQFQMPGDYVQTPSLRIQYSMTSATSGGVVIDASIMAVTSGDAADINTDSYATVNTCIGTAVPGTAGHLGAIVCPLTNADTLAANDLTKVKVCRNTTHASDTATGDLEGVTLLLSYSKCNCS